MFSPETEQMNRRAIASLEKGNYNDCLQSLRGALQGLRESLGATNQEGRKTQSSQFSLHSLSMSACLPEFPQVENGIVEVFNCALVFAGCSDLVDEHIVPATLLYNTGLCYHRRALREGNHGIDLKSAYQAYSHALTMLNAVVNDLRDSDMMIVAALANNMANISSLVFNVDDLQIFSKILEDVVETTDMDDFGDDDAYSFFSINLMFVTELQWHTLAPAA